MAQYPSRADKPPLSREDFARHVRAKAEQAAEASVHHASLSQQYMELSQKLSSLAQQAGSANIAELQHLIRQAEHVASPPTPAAVLPGNPGSPSERLPQHEVSFEAAAHTSLNISSSVPKTADAIEIHATDGTDAPHGPDTQDDTHAPDNSTTAILSAKPRGAKRRVSTRHLVERARKAKLAAAQRVRVRAKKADLKLKPRSATEELRKGSSSIATSMAVLVLVLCVMSLITWQLEEDVKLPPLMAAFADEVTEVEEPVPIEVPEETPGEQMEQMVEEPAEQPEEPVEPEPAPPEPEKPPEPPAETPPADTPPEETPPTEAVAAAMEPVPVADSAQPQAADNSAASTDAAVDNRSEAGRKALLAKYGGSAASESAVQYALEWLISIQHPQGYWDFVSVGESRNAGTINNPIGGTAYALLPFLAAGQTHKEGKYQKQIGAALTYLTKVGVNVPAGYDLRGMLNKRSEDQEPNEAYYVHGAATLALCEAYGMTKDRRLKKAAEDAIRFIVNSQDPRGGGWRYNPQEPGSTSVTAIQVMALMAGKKAGIEVPPVVLTRVMYYLDSVQTDGEGRYGYEAEKRTYKGAITAMALLCRMYLGWGRDDGDMRAGIALLDKAGPYDNLYSLYFATQVMKNWGGEEWHRWNLRLRDDLVAWQETEGAAKGSWKPRTGAIHAKQGGRLLTTALAALTLQVYYRYEPLLPEMDQTESSAK